MVFAASDFDGVLKSKIWGWVSLQGALPPLQANELFHIRKTLEKFDGTYRIWYPRVNRGGTEAQGYWRLIIDHVLFKKDRGKKGHAGVLQDTAIIYIYIYIPVIN